MGLKGSRMVSFPVTFNLTPPESLKTLLLESIIESLKIIDKKEEFDL